jgi:hypothetical protein
MIPDRLFSMAIKTLFVGSLLWGLPTVGNASADINEDEVYQWVLPIAQLKQQLPTDEDFSELTDAVRDALKTDAVRDALKKPVLKKESISLACQALETWSIDLDPDHRIWAFSLFSTLFEEVGSDKGAPDEETANVIAEWTSRFMHDDYNEYTCFIIIEIIKEAILKIGPLDEAETVLKALRIGSTQQRNKKNPNADDWTNDCVIRSLRSLLASPN